MNQSDIIFRLDALTLAVNQRMDSFDQKLVTEIGSVTYFMTEDEKREIYELKQKLPTFGELQVEAKRRIAQRIHARRSIKNKYE